MIDERAEVPGEFVDFVRDALSHLYDLAYLQTHPLLSKADLPGVGAAVSGRLLRQALLDAIETLRPDAGVAASSRAWRAYHILEARYITGSQVSEVIKQVGLSRSHYHREHNSASQAVAAILWERWHRIDRSGGDHGKTGIVDAVPEALVQSEAEHLVSDGEIGSLDPASVLQGVAELLAPLYSQRNLTLRMRLTEHLPPIQGNRVSLRQALLAILGHATNVSSNGIIDLTVRPSETDLVILISGPATATMDSPELGITKSLPFVQALGGTVTYTPPSSVPGRWFAGLTLPAHRFPTLLVVDNHLDFIDLIRRYLTDSGWKVLGTSNADEAIRLARGRHPEVILLDVVIPGWDGWDLLLNLKQTRSTRDIPVVICSILDEPGLATSLGASRYLQKPITQLQLIELLNTLGGGGRSSIKRSWPERIDLAEIAPRRFEGLE